MFDTSACQNDSSSPTKSELTHGCEHKSVRIGKPAGTYQKHPAK